MEIVFLFYEGMTGLDLVGPHEILCRLTGSTVKRVSRVPGSVRTDSGLILTAEYALSDVSKADVLVIPGAGSATSLSKYPEILAWVRSIHETTTWTTSVCTGSIILGAAGVLRGKKATSHWAALDRLHKWEAIPIQERIVKDGKVMTAAGVSAGIDMALTLTAEIAGQSFAEAMQLGIEYDPMPPFDVGSPAKANPVILEELRASMIGSFEEEYELKNN